MPQPESFAKGACQHCGGHIEFPFRGAGQKICCPHCDKPTLLSVTPAVAPAEVKNGPGGLKRIYMAATIAAGVLAAGGGAYFYFNASRNRQVVETVPQAQSSNASPIVAAPVPLPKPEPPPDPWHGLKPGTVALEKKGDGRLIYAVGTLTNATSRQRFGVKVQLDVLDEHRNKIGSATDYTDLIEPGKEWKYRALVTDKTATAAALVFVTEQE